MTKKNLEQAQGAEEQVKVPSKKEEVKPVSDEQTKPVSEVTYSEEEVQVKVSAVQSIKDEEVRDALGKASEAQKKADSLTETLRSTQSQLETLTARQQELEDAGVKDDPEGQAILKRLRQDLGELEQAKKGLVKEKAELAKGQEELTKYAWQKEAEQLSAKHAVPVEILLKAENIYDMKIKASDYELERAKREKAQLEAKTPDETPTPDKGVSSGGGSLTFKQLEQDYADGTITYEEYAKARKEQGL